MKANPKRDAGKLRPIVRLDSLATKLARAVFKCGDYPRSVCRRIQFKGGRWPDTERDQGGLCESALRHLLLKELEKLTKTNKSASGPSPAAGDGYAGRNGSEVSP